MDAKPTIATPKTRAIAFLRNSCRFVHLVSYLGIKGLEDLRSITTNFPSSLPALIPGSMFVPQDIPSILLQSQTASGFMETASINPSCLALHQVAAINMSTIREGDSLPIRRDPRLSGRHIESPSLCYCFQSYPQHLLQKRRIYIWHYPSRNSIPTYNYLDTVNALWKSDFSLPYLTLWCRYTHYYGYRKSGVMNGVLQI